MGSHAPIETMHYSLEFPVDASEKNLLYIGKEGVRIMRGIVLAKHVYAHS